MIATWKRQAIDGMAATFSDANEAAKATGDTEIEKLHAKSEAPTAKRTSA